MRLAIVAAAALVIAPACAKKKDKGEAKTDKVGTKKLIQKTPLEPKKRDKTPAPKAQLDGLIAAMKNDEAAVRLQAVRTLATLAERAVAAAPELIALLSDKRTGVRLSAATALSSTILKEVRKVSTASKLPLRRG